jgi:epoxyqueuosine reductase
LWLQARSVRSKTESALTATGDFAELAARGLNLHAVFDLDGLPAEVAAALPKGDPEHSFRQLILIGHGGRALWTSIRAARFSSDDPVDDFSVAAVERWFDTRCAGRTHGIIYPGTALVPLQALGRLAGWHHDSPLGLGINARWGTWFAYRVALLADTALPPTAAWTEPSPCAACKDHPCITHCPGNALKGGTFALESCVRQRKLAVSVCRASCPARIACPIGEEHRYDDAQMRHHYLRSLRTLQDFA